MVNAVCDQLGKDVLANTSALRLRVNQHLGWEDLTSANIRVALEQIPCTVMRQKVLRELATGAFHPKEEVVLAELFAAVEQDLKDELSGGQVGAVQCQVGSVQEARRGPGSGSGALSRQTTPRGRCPVRPCPRASPG